MSDQSSSVPSRQEIKIGQTVWGLQKKDYTSGVLTTGVVLRILTNKPFHPRGIKVMLKDDTVIRVQRITPPEDPLPDNTPTSNLTLSVSIDDDEYDLR